MPENVLFPEFRNEVSDTRYPFTDTASLTTADGSRSIDKGVIQDAAIQLIGATGRVYLAGITVAPRLVTLTVADEGRLTTCQGTFDPYAPPACISLFDTYGRAAGVLVSSAEQLGSFNAWASGEYSFSEDATEFVLTCVIPTPEVGVRGLLTESGELLTGDVWLVGDNGVVFREVGGAIRVDIVGDPLFARKLCGQIDLFTPPRFLKTINGCPPDLSGEYQILAGNHSVGDTVLRIFPVDDGSIKISAIGKVPR